MHLLHAYILSQIPASLEKGIVGGFLDPTLHPGDGSVLANSCLGFFSVLPNIETSPFSPVTPQADY